MKQNFAVLAGLVVASTLAGCAAPVAAPQNGNVSAKQGIVDVKVESSNSASVTLTNIFWSNDANNQKVADSECAKYKKVAQFVAKERDRRRYNCVKP